MLYLKIYHNLLSHSELCSVPLSSKQHHSESKSGRSCIDAAPSLFEAVVWWVRYPSAALNPPTPPVPIGLVASSKQLFWQQLWKPKSAKDTITVNTIIWTHCTQCFYRWSGQRGNTSCSHHQETFSLLRMCTG